MPSLNWIGKEKIVNHDKDVPFRLMRKNKKYSLGNSENLILEGDNEASIPDGAEVIQFVFQRK